MPLSYDPDSNVEPNATWNTVFLSDRDVSAQVPINFVPHPGVYVTAACFGQNIYEDSAAENCLSNLLSSSIQRYVIDVYWDTANQRFGLCPVEIPAQAANSSINENYQGAPGIVASARLNPRQIANTSTTSPSATSAVSRPIRTSSGGSATYQLGPYQCSDSLTLNSIAAVFNDYLQGTADTIQAKLLTWILNLHVASTTDDPTVIREQIAAELLPNSSSILSSNLNRLNDILYTPEALQEDRVNLNTSWFRRASVSEYPLSTYFRTYTLSDGDIATDDGWPDQNFVQVVRGKRLLIGFGTIDAVMAEYNYSADGSQVYSPGYLSASQDIRFDSDGQLLDDCYFSSTAFEVAQVNNSWATTTINSINPPDLGDAADNLTTCGFSQLLNVTIDGITADQNATAYQSYGNNAIFSWAYNQPENNSVISSDSDSAEFRCALMVSNGSYRGHWRTQFCNDNHRVACREGTSPYLWRISTYSVPYDTGDAACRGNTTFDVPRTGLENTYLYNRVLEDARVNPEVLDGVWVNFNSLDREGCWVTTGVNGTCPYYQDSSAVHSRQILIPAIAALIVLMLTVLTILAKCSANARSSRTRRKGDGGWDYEGIPS